MPAMIACPSCGKRLQAQSEPKPGTTIRCPKCENKFVYKPTTADAPLSGGPSTTKAPPPIASSTDPATRKVIAPPVAAQPPTAKSGGLARIVIAVVVLAVIAAAGYYFGRDLFKKNKYIAKSKDAPATEQAWDKLFDADTDVDAAADADMPDPNETTESQEGSQSEGQSDNPDDGQNDTAPDESGDDTATIADEDRMRPQRFDSSGPSDVLQDPLGNAILDVEYSPDNRVLVAYDAAGLATLWDLKSRRGIDLSFNHLGGSTASDNDPHIAFSKDGRTLIFGTPRVVTVVELPELKLRWQKTGAVDSGNLVVSPTLTYVALLEDNPDSSTEPPSLNIYEVSTGKRIYKTIYDFSSGFTPNLVFSPDDQWMAIEDGVREKLRLFALPSGEELPSITGVIGAADMVITPDGKELILPNSAGDLQIWNVSDIRKPRLVHRAAADDETFENLLSPDGRLLASLPRLWDVAKRQESAVLQGTTYHGAFSTDSKRIAYWGPEVVVANTADAAIVTVLNAGKSSEFVERTPSCAAFSHDGNQIAIGTADGAIVLKSLTAVAIAKTENAGENSGNAQAAAAPNAVTVSPIDSFTFSTPENLVSFFEGSSTKSPDAFASHVWISPDNRWIVTRGFYTTFWDYANRQQHMVLCLNDGKGQKVNDKPRPNPLFPESQQARPMDNIQGWLLHEDGRSLVAAREGGMFVHYDIEAGTHLIDGNDPGCEGIKLAPDGSVAALWKVNAAASADKRWELMIVDGHNGTVLKPIRALAAQNHHPYGYPPIETLSFSPDGRRLAVVAYDRPPQVVGDPRVFIWDWESGTEYFVTAETRDLSRIDMSEDGKTLVALNREKNAIELFDIEQGTRIGQVNLSQGHSGRMTAFACHCTQPLVATADEHGILLLRDLKTGEVKVRCKAHESVVTAACFSTDGELLVTAASDRSLNVWRVSELLSAE